MEPRIERFIHERYSNQALLRLFDACEHRTIHALDTDHCLLGLTDEGYSRARCLPEAWKAELQFLDIWNDAVLGGLWLPFLKTKKRRDAVIAFLVPVIKAEIVRRAVNYPACEPAMSVC